jgi:Tfp pilus assembly protein PilN
MDLKKEIKLSDLFRRGKGAAGEDETAKETPPKEKKARKSFSFSRTKEPKAPKEPKATSGAVSRKSAPPPPAVPLMRAFDLMPKEGEGEKRSSASPAFLKVAAALVAVLVLAALAGAYMLMDARAKERQTTVDDLRAQLATLAPTDPADETPHSATLTAEGQARTAAVSEALAARVAWDRILREFSLVLPEGVWLTTLASATAGAAAETDPDAAAPADPTAAPADGEGTFTISGFATSQEDVALLLSRLEVIPEFSSVQLQSSSRGTGDEAEGGQTSGDSQDISFSIAATIAPAGVPAQ